MNERIFTPPNADEIEMAKRRLALFRALILGDETVEPNREAETFLNANVVRALIMGMEVNLATSGLIDKVGATGPRAGILRIQSVMSALAVLVVDRGMPPEFVIRSIHESLDDLIEAAADVYAEKLHQMQAAAKDGAKKPPPEWR